MGSKFLLTRNPNSIHSLSRIQILTIRELDPNMSLIGNIENYHPKELVSMRHMLLNMFQRGNIEILIILIIFKF